MARIAPLPFQDTPDAVKSAYAQHIQRYNARITNMKATLGHSLVAFEVYMEWYRLYECTQVILGERLAYLFAYSISVGSNCPLCSVFFRKIIIDKGEQLENMQFSETEQLLITYCRPPRRWVPAAVLLLYRLICGRPVIWALQTRWPMW